MAQSTVHNIEVEVKAGLKQCAALDGWGLEEEVRPNLPSAVSRPHPAPTGLGTRISERFIYVGLTEPLPEFGHVGSCPVLFGA